MSEAELEDFQQHRALLFSIAYRMLGSASDAEDIVQDAFLRYRAVPVAEIRSPKSYLTTIVTRLCLDYLKSARAEREQYVGVWLPEPILTTEAEETPQHATELYESVSLAFLTLLECLSPQERAVFLLHEVFEYNFQEIAAMLGKNAASCRQILHRAKERVDARKPRFEPSMEAQARLTESFLMACQQGDVQTLTDLLAEDATLWSDGGGKVAAALRPVLGRDFVVRFIFGVLKKYPEETDVGVEIVNGRPGVLLWYQGELVTLLTFQATGAQIKALHVVRNPDKLAFIKRQLQGQWQN